MLIKIEMSKDSSKKEELLEDEIKLLRKQREKILRSNEELKDKLKEAKETTPKVVNNISVKNNSKNANTKINIENNLKDKKGKPKKSRTKKAKSARSNKSTK